MKTVINPAKDSWPGLLKRPTQSVEDIEATVMSIFRDVEKRQDDAILDYTQKFDGVRLKDLHLSDKEIETAINDVPEELKAAINHARINIERFHKAQLGSEVELETTEGVYCWQEKRPIEKVGLYIPGGTAPLFSTILMLAIPAQLAGCKEIVLCSPPNAQGKLASEIIYTAQLCGVSMIVKAGGIQAIAGLTFGTASIPKVYKIFGPGNQYVTVAKQLATKFGVAIDMPAGPSELLVVADRSANPSYVAADLLSQAEHGADSQVILVSLDLELLVQVEHEIQEQIKILPRKHLAKVSISNSKMIYLDSQTEALDFINAYAPEHLIIACADPGYFIEGIMNAGSVFVGHLTPESAGDYASGTNHTLPTNGYARNYSGVNCDSFLKTISFQKLTKEGLQNIGNTIELMAEAEGLFAHKNAVSLRLKDLNSDEN
ncbi:MAG: histidinol dehydrogenase [Flavobacteriaceae bacterium]|nr:histidinol dehydrogenase [Bacteroidia bacterium]MBT8287971.1 histidinol dehydrogenase [Bacteroidia bacterium]NNF76026.1 histidinol dehydrogenase [Flavobacteriaceae bacterium]NNK73411.1 histidinol dehydrogenase [Flavobacteriaceae bacterium]